MNKLFCRTLTAAAAVLLNCTILSGFFQAQMTVEVSTISLKYDHAAGGSWIPADAVRWEEGLPFLYTVEEGFGLTAGLWAGKTSTAVMAQEEDRLLVPSLDDKKCILYASRPFVQGERVKESSSLETAADQLLLWLPPEAEVSLEGETASGAGGTYWLWEESQVSQPFFQQRELAKRVPEEVRSQGKLVSLKELRAFLDALPWLALGAVLAAGSLVMALLLALCLGTAKRRKTVLFLGAGWVVFLAALLWLVSWVDLPSSLLPVENLLDLGHYRDLLSWAKEGLQAFSGSASCGSLLGYMERQQLLGGCLLGAGVLLAVGSSVFAVRARKSLPGRGEIAS